MVVVRRYRISNFNHHTVRVMRGLVGLLKAFTFHDQTLRMVSYHSYYTILTNDVGLHFNIKGNLYLFCFFDWTLDVGRTSYYL